MIFCCINRLRDFFGTEKFSDFFCPERLHALFFFCPKKLRVFLSPS